MWRMKSTNWNKTSVQGHYKWQNYQIQQESGLRERILLFCPHHPSPPLLAGPACGVPDSAFCAGLSTSPSFPPPIHITQRSTTRRRAESGMFWLGARPLHNFSCKSFNFFPQLWCFRIAAQAGACAEHRARPRGSAGTAHRAAVSPPAPCPSALPLSFILQLLCPHSPCTMRLEQLWFHSYLSLHCSVQFLPSDPFCLLSYLPD